MYSWTFSNKFQFDSQNQSQFNPFDVSIGLESITIVKHIKRSINESLEQPPISQNTKIMGVVTKQLAMGSSSSSSELHQ